MFLQRYDDMYKSTRKSTFAHITILLSLFTENKITKEEPQAISKPQKEEEKQIVIEDKEADEEKDEDDDKEVEEAPMDVSDEDSKSNDATESPEKVPEKRQIDPPKLNIRLPFAHQAEKGNLAAFRQRIQTEIEITKMLCKRCDTQFSETQELYDHVAEHVKWMRYACKLCNFKHYYFEKLPEHVKVVHKLKGDKDFYYSTVKAIDGPEALELCESPEEVPDAAETSPESRRPSRCSSDSSRLSDDSSSSSTRVEGLSRKRKVFQSKTNAKKRKEYSKRKYILGVLNLLQKHRRLYLSLPLFLFLSNSLYLFLSLSFFISLSIIYNDTSNPI